MQKAASDYRSARTLNTLNTYNTRFIRSVYVDVPKNSFKLNKKQSFANMIVAAKVFVLLFVSCVVFSVLGAPRELKNSGKHRRSITYVPNTMHQFIVINRNRDVDLNVFIHYRNICTARARF